MRRPSFFFIVWPALFMVSWTGCAGVFQKVTFSILRPPLTELSSHQKIALIGFNGEDVGLSGRVAFLLHRRLSADTTLTFTDPGATLLEVSRHVSRAGRIPDSLALSIGRAAGGDVALVGQTQRWYTEEYGEEKKYRLEEVYRPAGGNMQIRLDPVPYYEPYINQAVAIDVTIRLLNAHDGTEFGRVSARVADTLHIVLPTRVEKPPRGAVSVERVTPALLDRAVNGVVDRLAEYFVRHPIPVTRHIYRKTDGEKSALSAVMAGDWERARLIWEQVVQESPDNASAWNNLGVAYEQAGRPVEAQSAYDRAFSLKPNDPVVRQNTRMTKP